jgi:hypothetical protein
VEGEEVDLLAVDVDAVGREQSRAQKALARERTDPGRAERLDQELGKLVPRPRAALEPFGLGRTLGEVRRDREPELRTCAVEVERARVRRVRRDAGSNGARESIYDAYSIRLEPLEPAPIFPEDLEVDDGS